MARFNKLASSILSTSTVVSVMAAFAIGCGAASENDSDVNEAASENTATNASALSTGNEKFVGETGQVILSNTVEGGVSATVTMRNKYANPVVVAFINTRNGDQSVGVRVRSVSATSFQIFMQAPDNQAHAAETVSYIVMERGRHVLDGGLIVEADFVNTATAHSGGQSYAGDAVSFTSAFSATPAVLATLNSHNNNDFMASMVTNVGTSGFQIGLERAETGKIVVSEKVGFMAFSTGSGTTNGSRFMVGQGADGKSDGVTNAPHNITLSGFSAPPNIVVSVVEKNGLDGCWARGAGPYSSTMQAVFAEEDQIQDSERSHADEAIAYAAFAPNTNLALAGRSTKWRLRNASIPSSGQWSFRELKFCTDSACASPLSGTAIDSGHAMSWALASYAFDGNTSTMWKTTDANAEGTSWIGLELASAADVKGVYLKTDNIVYHSDDIYVEYYDSSAGLWVTTDVLEDLPASSDLTKSVSSMRSYFYVTGNMTGNEAKAYCESLGTTLATINRADDNMTAAELCKDGGGILCWIGLDDQTTEGSPAWQDVTPVSYDNWNTRFYGAAQSSSEDCVNISGVDATWMEYTAWQYSHCSATDRSGTICNGPEMKREYVFVNQELTGDAAEAYCESLGDDYTLATITSDEENDTVTALCDASGKILCRIGLNDATTEGTAEFRDGAPVVYSNWNTLGYAANQGSAYDCVSIGGISASWMDYGGWQYENCSATPRAFICSHPVRK
ncbi:MAG TPA: lectin-like protein [Polyangium sp.]|nr:lectin-like protein [Polyangium sp.]